MSHIPSHLKYTPAHEWVSDNGDNVYTAGITDFAQSQLGDVVFVELPTVGTQVKLNDSIAVVESVKAASDVYAPLEGEIIAVNETLTDTPETLNTEPYESGWLFKIKLASSASLDHLLDADAYNQECQ